MSAVKPKKLQPTKKSSQQLGPYAKFLSENKKVFKEQYRNSLKKTSNNQQAFAEASKHISSLYKKNLSGKKTSNKKGAKPKKSTKKSTKKSRALSLDYLLKYY